MPRSAPILPRRPTATAAAPSVADRFVESACDRLYQRVRTPFGETTRAGLRAVVAAEVARARSYGLWGTRALMGFVYLGAAHGRGFELTPAHAWMRQMLLDPRISEPDDRMQLVLEEHRRRSAAWRRGQEASGRTGAQAVRATRPRRRSQTFDRAPVSGGRGGSRSGER